ncbi:MAG: hypothetical protein Q7R94_01780, partial [bacterium]|nr:hypothetical protein [bacterium]
PILKYFWTRSKNAVHNQSENWFTNTVAFPYPNESGLRSYSGICSAVATISSNYVVLVSISSIGTI